MIGKHLRDIWEAPGRHLGSKGPPRRHPGGTQEAPRRHPGGTQEAPRRHPGGTQDAPRGPRSLQEVLGKKVNTSRLKCKKIKKGQFHEAFLKVGVTKYRACQQNQRATGSPGPPQEFHPYLREAARTPTDKSAWGTYIMWRVERLNIRLPPARFQQAL